MRVLFGVCSWGLGHATRSLPLIRKLIEEGNEVTVAATGRSLELLEMELEDGASYVDFPDYPLPYTEKSKIFLLKFSLFSPKLIMSMIQEHNRFVKLAERTSYDIIISDNRYGVFHRSIPSYLITHQLRVISPARLRFIENSFERFNVYIEKFFEAIMVPDYEEDGISGDLAHNLNILNSGKMVYIGIISDFRKRDVGPDVDILFSISGPEPQRQILEDIIFQQVNDIDGNIILSLGRNLNGKVEDMMNRLNGNVQICDFLPSEKREIILNKSKFIASRSGYSTLMDIYGLEKKAMFIPTPQQTEQVYLAKYHEKKRNFHYVNQDELDLKKDLEVAKQYSGPEKKYDVNKTIDRFMEVIHR
jgi:uncharacterized protein (TIGR00661 family)